MLLAKWLSGKLKTLTSPYEHFTATGVDLGADDGRFLANVAAQQKLGVLPQRRTRNGALDCHHPVAVAWRLLNAGLKGS
jgi:hypothetical protein